jgi:MraZ protein
MESLSEKVDGSDFSDEQDNLSDLIFSSTHKLSIDSDGRIILPESLRQHAEIENQSAFVGKGKTFQIWKPSEHNQFQKHARERALADRLALRQRPQGLPSLDPMENGT